MDTIRWELLSEERYQLASSEALLFSLLAGTFAYFLLISTSWLLSEFCITLGLLGAPFRVCSRPKIISEFQLEMETRSKPYEALFTVLSNSFVYKF